uniref:Uncharacterized protein n=1 Tax=Brassica campestris TaxID=3711 RepID=M4DH43_BRACM
MAISKALIASLLISLLVLQLVQADVQGAGSQVDLTFATERAGLVAQDATVCHLVRTETTTSASAMLPSPPTVVAASALK